MAGERVGLNAEKLWYPASLFTEGTAQPCLGICMCRQERARTLANGDTRGGSNCPGGRGGTVVRG